MKLEAIAQRLQTTGVGTQGKDIHIGHMPAERDGILLRQPFGGSDIDHELPGWRQTSFQLVVRGKSFKDTQALIKNAVVQLTMLESPCSTIYVRYMRPKHDPLSYPLSAGGRFEFVVNMEVCYIDSGEEEAYPPPAPL